MTDERKTISVQALKGIVKKPSIPVTIEDMNRAISEAGAAMFTTERSDEQPKEPAESR